MEDFCYFCGHSGANTKEDIPPLSFFPKGFRKTIKVPAHYRCNKKWSDSKAIEYCRNLLTGLSHSNSIAQRLFMTKSRRSILRNYPLRKKMISELRKEIDIYSPRGIYLGSTPGVQYDAKLMDEFIKHIVKGLYYHHRGIVLSAQANINWKLQPFYRCPEWINRLPTIVIDNNIFRYRYAILSSNPIRSMWILGFYDLYIGTVIAATDTHSP
ncbi:MAG: hypothetical protein PHG31_05805 [Candidatus Omnitrophica bacterium]|nr:hypothetical protein [Candidatus Omnitrophota bacterium]